MAGAVPVFDNSPVTCDVVAAVTGGQVVETRAPSGAATQHPCGPAGAGSVTVLGVALIDATNAGQSATLATPLPPATVVAVQGVVPVTYAAAATYGALLKAAASGQVTPWVTGTDNPSLVIGKCMETAGVASGATVGKMRILNCS